MPDTVDSGAMVDQVRASAREQVQAAWQLQLEKITAALTSGWEAGVDRILNERFRELAGLLETRAEAACRHAKQELAGRLNQAVRQLRKFESERQWSCALVDSTAGFCGRAAFFFVHQGALELRAARGIEMNAATPVPVQAAPAFAGVLESKDHVVALRTQGELSAPITALVGEAPQERCYLFPLETSGRVTGILYADGDPVETSALETIASYGAAIWGRHRVDAGYAADASARELDLRAQRFARVRVAHMRLYRAAAVEQGRREGDLYERLKTEIDEGRDAFRHTYLTQSSSIPDYFHLELVRTLANENQALLGPEYPGPLA